VTWQLGGSAFVDPPTVALAVVSLICLVHFRNNSAWMIGGGAVIGWVLV
jgi:chromate transporter